MMFFFILAAFFYINAPVVNLKEHPNSNSDVVSQAIFSEAVHVQEKEGAFSLISTSDNYLGWVESKYVIKRETLYNAGLKTSRLACHIYSSPDICAGPLFTLPYGAKLEILDNNDPRWFKISLLDGETAYIQKGDAAGEPILKDKKDLVDFSKNFLGLPYTWGGRSSFGYDCSGFVQMLYSQIGIYLPRDAKDQAQDVRFQTVPLDALEPGDLIFFGSACKKIGHVGLFIGNDAFIHASAKENMPWLRTSCLSDFTWSGSGNSSYPYRIGKQFSHFSSKIEKSQPK